MYRKHWRKVWPEGTPISIVYPEIPLFELLRNAARKYPDRTAIIFYGNRITYKKLNAITDKFATALNDMNVKKGDRVALFLPNIPQFVIGYYSALKAGAIVTAISLLHEKEEIKHQLMDSGAETIISLDMLHSKVDPILNNTMVKNVIVTKVRDYLPSLSKLLAPLKGVKAKTFPNTFNFLDLIKRREPDLPSLKINPKEDLAVLQYTSGTTGPPKGAMLTHFNLVANAIQTYHWTRGWGYAEKPLPSPIILCLVPFFHIYGMTVAMNEGILSGSTLILIPKFEHKTLLTAIDKYKPTHFPGIPAMYSTILNSPEIKSRDLASLHICVSGGAPISVEQIKEFTSKTKTDLVEGYGLTEASPVTHCNPPEKSKRRLGSIGIPYPDTDAKIVDLETGEIDLSPNEVGELVIRGPQVMKGYWNKPEETKNAFRNGWFLTGDIASMDEDGYFYIFCRKRDMMISSGFRILPKEVEEVLHAHPAIKEAAVIGILDPYQCATGLKAFIVPENGYEGKVDGDDIIRFCEKKLVTYKIPRFIEVRKELPKTAVGEIFRRNLREEDAKKM